MSTSHNDLICLSHLRWNFVFQRPQHLMSRFARQRRVFFVEEPLYGDSAVQLDVRICPSTKVCILTPRLQNDRDQNGVLHDLLLNFAEREGINCPVAWFYTPMAITFFPMTLTPAAVVYDCMDQLSLFRGAPPELVDRESQLLEIADLVFTGGMSLFAEKRSRHPRVTAFPSGVDVEHFRSARSLGSKKVSEGEVSRPRIGYAGVIDERIDLPLIAAMAQLRPEWDFVMIGPVVKIDENSLPRRDNIHWLGMKDYQELPAYFSAWDAGMMPFALNESTRFISPTKTPEYLAAGLPVVSTPITDVVHPYGESGLVEIAASPTEFVDAVERVLRCRVAGAQERIDRFLDGLSWDAVWKKMNDLLASTERRPAAHLASIREAARV
jgi:glycosyltransferase involved in cell wall biosynthesis